MTSSIRDLVLLRAVSLFPAIAILALGAGCGGDAATRVPSHEFYAEDPFAFDVTAEGRTSFRLEGINGTVDVAGGASGKGISVSGIRRVEAESVEEAEARLVDLEVDVSSEGAQVLVRTREPQDTAGRGYIVNYTVTLPANLRVVVVNVNGNITIDSMENDVDVQAGNGQVILESIAGSALVAVTNGTVIADVEIPLGGRIVVETINGTVDLSIPVDTSALFEATVVNGTIGLSGLALSARQETPVSLTGVLGSGDGQITLSTVNGTIDVSGRP